MKTSEKWAFFFASAALSLFFAAGLYLVAGDKETAMQALWVVGSALLILAFGFVIDE